MKKGNVFFLKQKKEHKKHVLIAIKNKKAKKSQKRRTFY